MILQINEHFDKESDLWNVELEGEIDVYTAKSLKSKLNELLEEKMADIKMNCQALQYIDSTGLGALIGIRGKMLDENKQLILTNVKPNVGKLLKITGLDKIFNVE